MKWALAVVKEKERKQINLLKSPVFLRWDDEDFRKMPNYESSLASATIFNTPDKAINAIQLRSAAIGFSKAKKDITMCESREFPEMSSDLQLVPIHEEWLV